MDEHGSDPPPALRTRVAQARWGDNRFWGYSVLAELAGTTTQWSAISLAVGHRRLTDREARLLDDVIVCSLAADPRIWPLKVVRLLSAYGNVAPGLVAGVLCTEGGFMGWRAYAPAATFLQTIARDAPSSDARIAMLDALRARGDYAPGFGVAFRRADERATALARCVRSREMDGGRFWTLLQEVDALLRPRGAPMNIAAASAAVFLDLGFTPAQLEALGPYLLFPNYLANALEGATQAPSLLRRLPADNLEDRTPPPRRSPRASED